MIEISTLKESDKDRIVVYKANGLAGVKEKGKITSWNDHYIFVDYYGTGNGTATRPENLTWDQDDQMLTDLSNEMNEEQKTIE